MKLTEITKNDCRRDRTPDRAPECYKLKASDDLYSSLSPIGRHNTSRSYQREGSLAGELLKFAQTAKTLVVAVG